MFKVRMARSEDIPHIARIERLCAEQPWSAKLLESELGAGHARLLVAENGEEIAGFCDMHIVADDAHINELAVLPAHRRMGFARALLDEALALCRAAGCAQLTLEVRAHNEPAIALYKTCGLAPCGARKGFYQHPDDDAVTMIIKL